MAGPLSRRQVLYREYLKTEHWKELRQRALIRDGEKCSICGSIERLQVHHKCYRGRYEDSLLKDLKSETIGFWEFEAPIWAGLMFKYVVICLTFEKDRSGKDRKKWRDLAMNVHASIHDRIPGRMNRKQRKAWQAEIGAKGGGDVR